MAFAGPVCSRPDPLSPWGNFQAFIMKTAFHLARFDSVGPLITPALSRLVEEVRSFLNIDIPNMSSLPCWTSIVNAVNAVKGRLS